MEHHQSFSPGLLYSVAPENFSELHLQDEEKVDAFEWEEHESALTRLSRTIFAHFQKPSSR